MTNRDPVFCTLHFLIILLANIIDVLLLIASFLVTVTVNANAVDVSVMQRRRIEGRDVKNAR